MQRPKRDVRGGHRLAEIAMQKDTASPAGRGAERAVHSFEEDAAAGAGETERAAFEREWRGAREVEGGEEGEHLCAKTLTLNRTRLLGSGSLASWSSSALGRRRTHGAGRS